MVSKRNMSIFVLLVIAVVALVFYYIVTMPITKPLIVQNGDNVTLFYSLRYTNNTLIQSDFNSTPFSFVVGSGQVIAGFNAAVTGMVIGQTKTFTVQPGEGYGNINSSLIITVPISDFGNSSLSDGELVNSANGGRGIIISFNSTNVTVNFNNPLAGKTLVFIVKLVSINGSR